MKVIARIRSPYREKFGIPRQSGLADVPAEIVFEPEYRVREAFRGLEKFSHLWLIWEFSETAREKWSPTVRPPKLGGNVRVGVFATRSPFRPNPIGLSAVRLEKIDWDCPNAPVLTVSGADMLDGTPLYDIKPYLAYADSHPEAIGELACPELLTVRFPEELLEKIPPELRQGLLSVLEQDPRPGYQDDRSRVYGMDFGGYDIRFTVSDGVLTVKEVRKAED